MRRLIVVGEGNRTIEQICLQLRNIIGDRIEISGQSVCNEFNQNFKGCLAIFTSPDLIEGALSKIPYNIKYIVARRGINYHYISNLIQLPAGSKVLLVNDSKLTCLETITQLERLGIDHIKYYPYYPEIESYEKLDLAVTPGEAQLAPASVNRVINIEARYVDITTIVEILTFFNLMEDKASIISAQYAREIVDLSKRYNYSANHSLELTNMFKIIVDNSSDGVLYLNEKGYISASNQVFASIMGTDISKLVHRNVEEIIPQLRKWKVEELERDIVKFYGRNVVLTKAPVMRNNQIVGYMINMKDVTEIQKLEQELRRKMRNQEHVAKYEFQHIISKNSMMEKNIELAKRLAQSSSTILIQGESGTGKEYFVQAIHNYSRRAEGPFVPVNFAALTSSLIESELFGYEEGAFTGAKKGGSPGLFEEAHGGTIFLDEIGDAPLDFQVKLLRVLQERMVRRIGGKKLIPIDVRVIAATNKDLKKQVCQGSFRQDLFYRINVLPLYILPLRDRVEDIPLLIETYISKFTDDRITSIYDFIDVHAVEYLKEYNWPGNIRELVNVIEYLVNIKDAQRLITVEDFPSYIKTDKNNYGSCNNAILSEVSTSIDNDMLWLLKEIYENKYGGRRTLAGAAKHQGLNLGEGKIRGLMKLMEDIDIIKIEKGVRGSTITSKGKALLLSGKFL
jgi:PAS domain S-box-containing protein